MTHDIPAGILVPSESYQAFLKAIQITYKISIGQSYEFMGMKVPDKTSEKEDLPSISDITAILDKEKIKYFTQLFHKIFFLKRKKKSSKNK